MPPAESVTKYPAPTPPSLTIHLPLEGAAWIASSAETDSEYARMMDWAESSEGRRLLFCRAIELALEAAAA